LMLTLILGHLLNEIVRRQSGSELFFSHHRQTLDFYLVGDTVKEAT
jgi:hypothetical protein